MKSCNFYILLEFACMLLISSGIILYLFLREAPSQIRQRTFPLESWPPLNYSECDLGFDGNLDRVQVRNATTRQSRFLGQELCLSREQVRVFNLTKGLRPRLNTNYSGYEGPWIEDGVFCNWMVQYSGGRARECGELERPPPVYVPIFWTSIQRNKVEEEVRRKWQTEAQSVLDSLESETLYFTVLQVSFDVRFETIVGSV